LRSGLLKSLCLSIPRIGFRRLSTITRHVSTLLCCGTRILPGIFPPGMKHALQSGPRSGNGTYHECCLQDLTVQTILSTIAYVEILSLQIIPTLLSHSIRCDIIKTLGFHLFPVITEPLRVSLVWTEPFNMLALRGIICIWTSAVLARAQGMLGGQQYPPCNSSILQGSQYIGCYDLTNEVLELQITGTDPTLYSYYPGWIETSDPTIPAYYDNSVDPANCTVACRGHGYKYAALYGGSVCRCMGNMPSTPAPHSSTNPLDPVTLNSCHAPGQYLPGNCPGDSSQFCGTGTYADVYVDNSFPLLSTINSTVEENHYSYIGCFHPGGGGNVNVGQLSYRVPAANLTGATSLTPCFEFCATLGFPFVEFDGGNSYTSLVIEALYYTNRANFFSIDAFVEPKSHMVINNQTQVARVTV